MTPGIHNILVSSDWGSQNILGYDDWGSHFIGGVKIHGYTGLFLSTDIVFLSASNI